MKKNSTIRAILALCALSIISIETCRAEVFIYFDNAAEPCYSAEFGYLRYSIKFEPLDFGVKGNFSIASIFASATIPEGISVPVVISDVSPRDLPDSARYQDRLTFSSAEWDTFVIDPPLDLDGTFWVTFSFPSQWIPFDLSEPDEWDPDRNMVETTLGWGPISCDMAAGVGVEIPLGVEEERVRIPTAFTLDQNYPNPFNPSTTISYTTRETGHVELIIYDIRGKRIMTLMDGPVSPGRHSVTWRSDTSLPSGIYLYQLCFGEAALRRKMFLSK